MAGESDLADTLAELLAELDRKNVQYALAGGWAFSTLVEPRATTDIDIPSCSIHHLGKPFSPL